MKRGEKILIVDDDPGVTRLVQVNLESLGYNITVAESAEIALEILRVKQPDLIILDVMLPGMDGFELCKRIRSVSTTPIIMLTAKVSESDRNQGLIFGADDYLTKPFRVQDLLCRVSDLLGGQQSGEESTEKNTLATGDLSVDFARSRVTKQGWRIPLTPTEYKLFSELAGQAGQTVTCEALLSAVWGPEYQDETAYLQAYINQLRRKLEDNPADPLYILSSSEGGYSLATTIG
jgi:two-component system KDP operon response regulator KdpE